jgi:hypothetical protein
MFTVAVKRLLVVSSTPSARHSLNVSQKRPLLREDALIRLGKTTLSAD